MAENSRGQNRGGQRNKTNGPSRNGPSRSNQEEQRGGRKQESSRGLRDTDMDKVRNNNRSPKGVSDKRYLSDYDGQLSDE